MKLPRRCLALPRLIPWAKPRCPHHSSLGMSRSRATLVPGMSGRACSHVVTRWVFQPVLRYLCVIATEGNPTLDSARTGLGRWWCENGGYGVFTVLGQSQESIGRERPKQRTSKEAPQHLE